MIVVSLFVFNMNFCPSTLLLPLPSTVLGQDKVVHDAFQAPTWLHLPASCSSQEGTPVHSDPDYMSGCALGPQVHLLGNHISRYGKCDEILRFAQIFKKIQCCEMDGAERQVFWNGRNTDAAAKTTWIFSTYRNCKCAECVKAIVLMMFLKYVNTALILLCQPVIPVNITYAWHPENHIHSITHIWDECYQELKQGLCVGLSLCQTPDPGSDGGQKDAGHGLLPARLGVAGWPPAWKREEEEGWWQEEGEGEGEREEEAQTWWQWGGGEKLKLLLPPTGLTNHDISVWSAPSVLCVYVFACRTSTTATRTTHPALSQTWIEGTVFSNCTSPTKTSSILMSHRLSGEHTARLQPHTGLFNTHRYIYMSKCNRLHEKCTVKGSVHKIYIRISDTRSVM